MPVLISDAPHRHVTQRSEYRYQFTAKHHGANHQATQWQPRVTLEEEFQVFDLADAFEIFDDGGSLYGIWRNGDVLQILGTWNQQIAKFPHARANEVWHGYPVWPISKLAPDNRYGNKNDDLPAKAVFLRMEAVGLLTHRQCLRLKKGDYV